MSPMSASDMGRKRACGAPSGAFAGRFSDLLAVSTSEANLCKKSFFGLVKTAIFSVLKQIL